MRKGTGSQDPSLISALKPAGMAAWLLCPLLPLLLSVTVTVTVRRPACLVWASFR
jgi:hypothetical protein